MLQTVILDSCCSGSGTRSTATIRSSSGGVTPPPTLDADLLKSLKLEIPTELQEPRGKKRRGVFVPVQGTHVLLAACQKDKPAQEITIPNPNATNQQITMGLFTHHLLREFRECNLSTTGYSELRHRVAATMKAHVDQQHKKVSDQVPECEGANQDRVLFRTNFALSKSTMRVFRMDGHGPHYIKAGSAMGIVVNTEFAVYRTDMTSGSAPIAHLVAKNVGPAKTILGAMEQGQIVEIPEDACVRVARFNDCVNGVRILVVDRPKFEPIWEKVFDKLESLPINVIWAEPGEISDVVIWPSEAGATFQSQAAVYPAQAPPRGLMSKEGVERLANILADVINFHFHLRRRNLEHPLQGKLGMQLLELQPLPGAAWQALSYAPKENSPDLFAQGLATGRMVEIKAESGKAYGLKLTNGSERDLFPYVLYYDLQDYSISRIYTPLSKNGPAPLPASAELRIGYAYNGEDLIHITMDEGLTQELGFFVLFVSTHWVDGEHLLQDSPFEWARGTDVERPDLDLGVWDTLVVSLLTHE